jgi:hypothetical protein
MRKRAICPLIAALLLAIPGGMPGTPLPHLLTGSAAAQDWNFFNPFEDTQKQGQEQRKAPEPEPQPQFLNEKSFAVERTDLAPVMANDGSGLPFELWRGLDVATFEKLIAELEIPPRSPALHALWLRLITSNVTPPSGGAADQKFMALRLETLYRSGLLEQASRELAKMQAASGNALVATLAARNEIGQGHKVEGCATARSGGAPGADFPDHLKGQLALIAGYCAAMGGDAPGAGLAAEMARDQGLSGSAGVRALDAISLGSKPKIAADTPINLLDYRLIEAAGGALDREALLKQAAPSLLAALALDPRTEPSLRLAAAEGAARVNAISPDELAKVYRSQAAVMSAGASPTERRASLFAAAEAESTPMKKVRLIRSFLDEARRADLYFTALCMVAPASKTLVPAPEIGWYSETGIEAALAASDYATARRWALFAEHGGAAGNGNLDHWLTLIDIADPKAPGDRADSLKYVEHLAVHGRLDPTLLNRLATVLDALEYNVPIPLWEAASRSPQPAGGHLPETGVLSELQDASKKREFGRTVLLVMKTLGPTGAAGAHMIALGDSIRALKRAGLEGDARRLGFEALFAGWPRTIVN